MKHTFILLLFTISAAAQTEIAGKVTDEKGDPIPGANVVIRDTYDGTSTAFDGTFRFTTEEKGPHFIDVTFVGFKSYQQSIDINGSAVNVSVFLKEEINQ